MFDTRQEVESRFHIRDGIISDAGQFYRCAVFAPYYAARAADAAADQIVSGPDGSTHVFEVTASDRVMFPELADAEAVAVRVDADGEAYCEPVTWADVHAMECADYADPFGL